MRTRPLFRFLPLKLQAHLLFLQQSALGDLSVLLQTVPLSAPKLTIGGLDPSPPELDKRVLVGRTALKLTD